MNHTLRRGLDRGYEEHEGELTSLRGRVDVALSARRMLASHGKAYCYYEEFTVNTLPNRILKSTLKYLANVPSLDSKLRPRLLKLYRELPDIDDVQLNKFVFRRVQLNSNNRFYRFLLNICELVQSAWLVDEKTGSYKFKDFIRDDRAMARYKDYHYDQSKLLPINFSE